MTNYEDRYDERSGNILGALSYLSVFFAPVLFPLIVWIFASPPGSTHSRNALFNHIWTWVLIALGFVALIFVPALMGSQHGMGWFVGLVLAVIFFIWAGILFILNIFRGIKLLIV
ncbi:hypothetical protein [Staphylococcus petrasii]|uniref:hypothetical protein n=1 Tax=Staphylococcus petrasii TaxID=1276936 RepID=UPI001F5790FE|nr:hypothetical protein [Staphylococcus petrasii]MCI2773964.1 hypothetical protein [Staphylococcus petrasii]